jgi:hypothetical protein
MVTERTVRTRAGWIGVEIGKSRVRTPGRPGFGLYRVRGSRLSDVGLPVLHGPHAGQVARTIEPTEWTGYLFTLAEIDRALTEAMDGPRADPRAPGGLHLQPDGSRPGVLPYRIPTRWTSAYRGPRTGRETWGPISAEGYTTVHSRRVARGAPDPVTGSRSSVMMPPDTVRTRQRQYNADYQEKRKPARDAGLAARHASKLRRNEQ